MEQQCGSDASERYNHGQMKTRYEEYIVKLTLSLNDQISDQAWLSR